MVLIDGGGAGGGHEIIKLGGGGAYVSIIDSKHFDDWIMKL